MNILVITTKVPYPPRDGGAKATLDLAIALNRRGHRIDFLCMNTPKHHINVNDFSSHIREIFRWYMVDVDTSIRLLPLIKNYFFSSKPYSVQRFTHHTFDKVLKDLITKENYDIIQIEGLYGLAYVDTIRSMCTSRIVYRAHNVEHFIWKRLALQEKNWLKKKYLKNFSRRLEKYEKSIINQYDLLVPISGEDAKFFMLAGNTCPMEVIPYGVDLDLIPFVQDAKKDVFFLGALDWLPNIDGLGWFVEKVFPLVRQSLPWCEFWIAGRNPDEKLQHTFRKEGIRWIGEVEDASRFMLDHGVMVVPLFAGSGIRVKIIEAMAHGKAIVATPVAAEGLPIENEQTLYITDDPEQMADEIVHLLLDEDLARRMQANARAYVEKHFSLPVLAERLEKFYHQMLTA